MPANTTDSKGRSLFGSPYFLHSCPVLHPIRSSRNNNYYSNNSSTADTLGANVVLTSCKLSLPLTNAAEAAAEEAAKGETPAAVVVPTFCR